MLFVQPHLLAYGENVEDEIVEIETRGKTVE